MNLKYEFQICYFYLQQGYGDVHLVPDMNTLRMAAWQDKTAMVFCDVKDNKTHKPVTVAPRSILRYV